MSQCQRCKTARSTSSMSFASLAAAGATERWSRSYRLCEDCRKQFMAGPDPEDPCSRCDGPGGDGCGVRAVVDGETVCLNCWWPTHLTDAPPEVQQVIDTIEEKWREMREALLGLEEAIAFGSRRGAEKDAEALKALRFQAAFLVKDAERLNAALPPEAEAFVQRYLGQPPYPTWKEVMIEMHPEAKEMFEKQGL